MKIYLVMLLILSAVVQFLLIYVIIKLFLVCTIQPPFEVHLGGKLFIS